MQANSASSTVGKTLTCKAAVCWAANTPLVVQDIEVDPPQPGEVRIRILYTSLCHTDITFWEDKPNVGIFPRIFGHEAAGIIESVGEGVEDLEEGDHVLPVFISECGHCSHCMSTKSNLCTNYRFDPWRGTMVVDNMTRFHVNDKPIYHFFGSTFSEYTVIESQNVVKVHPHAPLNKICVLSCGVTTGFGSSWKFANVEKGCVVAVFGLGTVGLAVAEGARIAGAKRIIGIDINTKRLEKSKTFGVTDFVNPRELKGQEVHEVIQEITNGGVDYSFECVGNSNVVQSAILSVHDGWGMAVVVGVEGTPTNMSLHPGIFLFGRTLTGAFFGGIKPKSELPKIVEMCIKNEIQLNQFITHELPFICINDAFELMKDGNCLRCIVDLNNTE